MLEVQLELFSNRLQGSGFNVDSVLDSLRRTNPIPAICFFVFYLMGDVYD
jgi:hypothetical protein